MMHPPMGRPGRGGPHTQESIKGISIREVSGKLIKHSNDYLLPVIIALILAAVGAVLTIAGPNQLGKITDYISEALYGDINMSGIAQVGIFLITIYLISAICTFVQHFIMSTVTLRVSNRLRKDISDKINRVPLKYFNKTPFGDVLSRMTNDIQLLAQALSNSLPSVVTAIAQFTGCLIMMFVTEWRMALAAVASTVLGFAIMMIIVSRSQRYFSQQQTALGTLNGYVEEMYSGHDVVKLSKASRQMNERFKAMNKEVYSANSKSQFLSGIMQPLMTFIGNLGYVAVCVVGSVLVLNGNVNFSVIVSFIMYVRLFTSPLSTLAQGMTNMQSAIAAGKRVFDFLEEEEMEDESEKQDVNFDVKGAVEFQHVRFSYPDKPDDIIIKDFSAKIEPGQKVAIVGPTGAGKTTIVNLLMRFFELNSGKILIDGVPTSDMKREKVHSLFSMVLQDTWMFEGTVRENLVYDKEGVSDEQLEEACKACGIYEFIMSLPHGFDTVLSENTTISAGQKQLFTIARAMIQNNPMLILDEATSSVDTRTELIAQKAMDTLMQNRTSFVIAHRLSTIRNSDLILVLKDGDIIEQGNHEQLLNKNGFYAELYKSQFEKAS